MVRIDAGGPSAGLPAGLEGGGIDDLARLRAAPRPTVSRHPT
jgi:hypothetical protein